MRIGHTSKLCSVRCFPCTRDCVRKDRLRGMVGAGMSPEGEWRMTNYIFACLYITLVNFIVVFKETVCIHTCRKGDTLQIRIYVQCV